MGDLQASDLAQQLKFLKEEVLYNRRKINQLEGALPTLDNLQRAYSTQDPTALTTVTDDTDSEQRFVCLDPQDTIPEVRECNFAEFKNRCDPNGKDGCYAVDVLVSGNLLHQEVQQEYKLRERLAEGAQLMPSPQVLKKNKLLVKAVKAANKNIKLIKDAQSEERWPRRIRIQSPHLLRLLARINREKWTDKPRTYYRPFQSLIYHHPNMKRALGILERKLAPVSDNPSPSPDDDDHSTTDWFNEDDFHDEVQSSPEALACLRAYVDYMDKTVMQDYHRFEKLDVTSGAKVRFSDLWYLFRTGELVYQEPQGGLPDRRDFTTGKQIWMTYYIYSVPEKLSTSAADATELKDAAVAHDDAEFSVGCYHIDYTGDEFCVVKKTVKIERFSGEMPVNQLPVYPMRFFRNWQDRLDHAVKTGESLLEFMREKHCSYNGWTLTGPSSGDSTADSHLQHPEHINSEVMVDFREAFQACPAWRPHRTGLEPWTPQSATIHDDFRIRWWSGPDRANLLGETSELIPVKTGISARQRNEFLSTDPFLVAVAENMKGLRPTTEKHITDDAGYAKALLTGRVYAYVFEERKFAKLAVSKLRLAPKTKLALDSLKIAPSVKEAIQGSIQGHFQQKNAERRMDQNWGSLDLIQGKGTGLFILLHGVPGVGKTATAEAIAQANGKPLFKITAGDLGMTPEKLEMSLRDIFRLASVWDCILLLDEVDTFFSQRSRADTATNKNALVSVFLRVLDYYDGVLFLTTNRAGVLDEAFISRIHSKILYQHLSLPQTIDIWKLNMERVRKIDAELAKFEKRGALLINEEELLDFAAYLFNEHSARGQKSGRWNGRQIRNAFQVARSLAYYEHSRDRPSGPPALTVRHFKTMHDITASFDQYRNSIRGANDAELALEAETRNDHFQDPLMKSWQDEYHEEHHKEASAAGEAYSNTGNVAVTTTVAVSGRGQQRPRIQQQINDDDDYQLSPGDNLVPHQQHRDYIASGGRNRSGSYLSAHGSQASSPPARDLYVETQPRRFQPSPRHSPVVLRDGMEASGNYIPAPAPRAGYPPSHGYSNAGYQYGSTPRNASVRGVSPSVGMYDSGMAGRDPRQELYSPTGNPQFAGAREGQATVRRHGSGGWNTNTGGQGHGTQYAGQGREQNMETDLSLDDVAM